MAPDMTFVETFKQVCNFSFMSDGEAASWRRSHQLPSADVGTLTSWERPPDLHVENVVGWNVASFSLPVASWREIMTSDSRQLRRTEFHHRFSDGGKRRTETLSLQMFGLIWRWELRRRGWWWWWWWTGLGHSDLSVQNFSQQLCLLTLAPQLVDGSTFICGLMKARCVWRGGDSRWATVWSETCSRVVGRRCSEFD